TSGLKNAPSCFQRLMDNVFQGIPKTEAEIYIDDVLLRTRTFEDHLKVADKVFERLAQYNLMIKLEKCHFLRKFVTYLGYKLSDKGLLPGKKKVTVG
ncbi:MAG: RNA-directed DNA polymerase, partial [bacterium]|nr:RNA-directed DNA polymerase [bacterium]